ncbi:MAG TPA: RHS repeat-associated core domain-containing protein [Pyrinomonadaceae bacterium]|nr:RHS repeat-associated core domain-containing protein [Pyrinomonadaceae bacterium]
MKFRNCFTTSNAVQTVTLVLVAAVLTSPVANLNAQVSRTTPQADGKRIVSTGAYVPPALRTDSGARRANGVTGKIVTALAAKRSMPAGNLPNLSESRKIRSSSVTSATGTAVGTSSAFKSSSAAQMQNETAFPQNGLACGDCDPSGGGGAGGDDPYFGTARTEPANDTGAPGVTLGSRNFNWSMPLVSLPGRAGLDVSVALSYNSLVWTKQGSAIQYNADHGTPAPGFQLGLPRLQNRFFDTDDNSWAYIMVTPSGGRVEMNQVGSTNVYESGDGSFTQLTFSGTTPVVRTTDGTQFIFGAEVSSEWRCTQIEDRNGNYISATYNESNGHLLTITDTLGRVLNFNYNGDGNLESISQTWGSTTHYYVWFVYDTVQMSFNFSGLTVYGAANNASQTILSYIAFEENTSYHFDYNGYGQVYQIRHKAPDGHELEHTFYNIDNPGTQTDCPRFTDRHDYAQDWNGGSDAITSYAETDSVTWTNPETGTTETGNVVQETSPDGTTIYKEYSHATGWDTGLTRLSEFYDGTTKKKWVSTNWTQGNTTLTFPQNPRVAETNIYDDGGNRKRTTIAYAIGYNLPTTVAEYSDGTDQSLLRSTIMTYVTDSAYVNQRLIGLPLERDVLDSSGNIIAKQDYQYDWGDTYFSTQQPSINFDATNFSSSFRIGRGNLSAVRRYDCTSSTTAGNSSLAIYTQRMAYNLAGEVTSTADALGHATTADYTDNFSDSAKNQNTLGYATTVTDTDGYASTAQYKYEYGAITRTHVPTSGTSATSNVTYLDVTRDYDDFGRLQQITNQTNGAYTHFDYETNANYVHTYQTIIDTTQANEFHSWQVFDGAGRVRETASDLPGAAAGHFRASYVIYDNMGRVIEQSSPAEVDSSWVPAGDDVAGWSRTQQTFDWKGRPLQTTNPDGTTQVLSYGGCGCAGGEVTTVQDEKGRQRRYTKDSLGRLATVEEMIWNTGNVYATTTYSYNARDQIIGINQAGQTRSFDYDGHGRLKTRTTPEQGATNYTYYDDDTTHIVTDARLVTTTYAYNNRHQITALSYNVTADPTGQTQATAGVSFTYDAAGNRTSMTDGMGSGTYNFNNLGQMYSETRTLSGLTSSYTLNYQYNLAGELQKITNNWSTSEIDYGYDNAGRLSNVGGSGYAGVTSYASSLSYRAFGAIKSMNFGDGHSLSTAYDNRLRPTTWNVSGVLGYNYTYNQTYLQETTGRVSYAQNISSGDGISNGAADPTLDRSYEYDSVGRLVISHSGAEARAHAMWAQWGTKDGPYSLGFDYDQWGNMTRRYGWGGEVQGSQDSTIPYYYSNGKNQRDSFVYDAAGNVTNDGTETYQYDATGQQTSATWSGGSYTPTFSDDPLVSQVTTIRLVHLAELRAEINKLRHRAGLADYSFTVDPSPTQYVTVVNHNHIQQLRTALEQALTALHIPIGTYAHAGPNAGDTIYAIDLQELRQKIKDAWTRLASAPVITQSYDGDGLRVKKNEYGAVTYYLRSSVLGGQVIAELDNNGAWSRGYVYSGSSLLAVQQGGVFWNYEDPVTKSKRVTDINGTVGSVVELDPWGADTNRSSYAAFQPKKYTSYERDANGSDEAMFRRYNRMNSRFDQPDPYEGSYNLSDPQSLNRYAYTQNDPANFVDVTGLEMGVGCGIEQSWEQCVGSGAFGGFAGNSSLSQNLWRDHPGYIDIWNDENRLHPLSIQIGETQYPVNFLSIFEGAAWWDGFDPPQNTDLQYDKNNACATMAFMAQSLATRALNFWGNAKDALIAFDVSFSQTYLQNNGIGSTYASAVYFSNHFSLAANADLLGESGFKLEFQDHEGDQTHHFAGHLTAGINDQTAAHNLQKVTDVFNKADRLLSNAAFKIGQDLRNDPRGLFTIGDRIMKDICAPK